MTTTLRYRVVAPGGIFIGEAFHPQGSVLSLTANAARYLLLSGVIALNSAQPPEPNEPGGPTEDDIRIVVTVGNQQKLISVTEFIKLSPSLDVGGKKLEAVIAAIKGTASSHADTLGEVEDRLISIERILDSGPDGSGNGVSQIKVMPAAKTILSLKVVRSDGSAVEHASSDDLSHVNTVIGLAINAALTGRDVSVKLEGPITDQSFDFRPGVVWLGLNGDLTQRAPTSGFLQKVAKVISSNSIMISLEEPIVLG